MKTVWADNSTKAAFAINNAASVTKQRFIFIITFLDFTLIASILPRNKKTEPSKARFYLLNQELIIQQQELLLQQELPLQELLRQPQQQRQQLQPSS